MKSFTNTFTHLYSHNSSTHTDTLTHVLTYIWLYMLRQSQSHRCINAHIFAHAHSFTLTLRNRVTYPYIPTHIWTLLPYHTQDHMDIYLHKQYTQTFSLTHPCHHFYTYTKKHIVTHVQRILTNSWITLTHTCSCALHYTLIHLHTNIRSHTCSYLLAYLYMFMHTHIHIWIQPHICTPTFLPTYPHLHTLSNVHICTCTYRNLLTCILTKYIHLYSLPHASTHT